MESGQQVICVREDSGTSPRPPSRTSHLSIGKTYVILAASEGGKLLIKNDEDKVKWYRKFYFKTIIEYRDNKLNQILG